MKTNTNLNKEKSKSRFLTIIMALAALSLIVSVMYAPVLAEESVPAYNDGHACNSDTIRHVSSSQTTYSSSDGYLPQMWGINKIEAPQAWQITKGHRSVVVAVLDTGIDKNNNNLSHKLVDETNFTNSSTNNDIYEHGTHMAGTIATIAPECQLLNVKVIEDSGKCESLVVASGIMWAVEHGALVINVSLSTKASPELEEAVNYAWNQGALVVAAAGNEGTSMPLYPAYYTNCLAVAATNEKDSLALLSSNGDWVDVAAPGFNIYSELPQNRYGYKSGTSSAAAHVSGVATLAFSIANDTNDNGLINDEVRQAIEDSCSPISANGVGKGLINALAAVTDITSAN
ncbi:MAG: S8 family serine peptidase [Chloroflexota bacterium]|nr:S8 family serine peptidase [Chloroflexota bacterium]